MAQRITFKVHGRVQGVNFRNFTQRQAKGYGITGYVRNTDDEKVEGEAQGEQESLQKFLKDLNNGPKYAHVVKLEKAEAEVAIYDKAPGKDMKFTT